LDDKLHPAPLPPLPFTPLTAPPAYGYVPVNPPVSLFWSGTARDPSLTPSQDEEAPPTLSLGGARRPSTFE
jgi:hypothetical protein